jgi:hypothetical protein
VAKGAARLTVREYLPMGAMIAFWAIVALGIGHADTARLLAATVMLRGAMMLAELSTAGPMRARRDADPAIRRRSLRNALLMQGAALTVVALVLAAVTAGLRMADHAMLAQLLWVTSIGLPARALRLANPTAFPRQLRLHVTGAAVLAAGIAWALGGGPIAMAAAYAAREWIATLTGALVGSGPDPKQRLLNEKLRFPEVAKTTVVSSRRLLTYRLTKNILTVFGPFGNFAARTGRGLNVHSKLERYMPHKKSGFVGFALLTGIASVLVAFYSSKPLALIGSAGLAQLSAVAINVLLLWRYLPLRDDPNLVVEEDDDD